MSNELVTICLHCPVNFINKKLLFFFTFCYLEIAVSNF